jgi:N-methylhydantoinase A/oxoprolinase/acetone carboxylase beta subunit
MPGNSAHWRRRSQSPSSNLLEFGKRMDRMRVYQREALAANVTKNGPALIEEATTTTLVLQGQTFELHPTGQLIIREAT